MFVFSGIIFFKNCVIMRFKTTKDIDNFLSDKTNNIKEIEAEYISWGNYNIVSKIINMNKVKLHINDGNNRTFFLLMNLSDYYEIIRFIQEKLPRAKFKLNLSGIPSEQDSLVSHYPTIPDMV